MENGVKDSGHAPPHPRPYDGLLLPYLRAVRAARLAAWPAPPSRPGAIAPRRVPCGGLMAVLGTKKECGGMKIARLARAPPAGLWPPGLVVVGAWWCGAGPAVGRRRSAPVSFRRRPKRGGAAPRPGSRQSWGPGLGALRAARRAVWPFPRGGCVVVGGVSAAPGGAGSPWPALARPRLGAVIGWPGPPSAPAGDGRGPLSGGRAVVLFGLVPCRRRSGALLRSRRATVIEGSALPGARGFRRLRAAREPGKAPGKNAVIANERHP